MIIFKCQCGHQFSEPDDHAGLELQCPNCLRLVDVPRLSEVAGLAEDGTYVLTGSAEAVHPVPTLDDVIHAFHRNTVDKHGVEKDLRLDEESLAKVGTITLQPSEQVVAPPPRYDPETGELVTTVDIVPQVVTPIPIIDPNIGKTLKYAVASKDASRVNLWKVPLDLLTVPNLTVMAFPFFCVLVMALVFAMLASAMLLPLGLSIMVGLAVFSHFASVPREMGYNDRDELPRPLGDLDLLEDILNPMGNLLLAFLICYWPGVFVENHSRYFLNPLIARIVIGMAGDFFFPAVFLTLTNSGSLFNLRPDRVLGVIRATGGFYLVLVAEWLIAVPLYSLSTVGVIAATIQALYHHPPRWILPLAIVVLAVAIYLLYLFLWQLGLAYRKYSENFPWIWERFKRVRSS